MPQLPAWPLTVGIVLQVLKASPLLHIWLVYVGSCKFQSSLMVPVEQGLLHQWCEIYFSVESDAGIPAVSNSRLDLSTWFLLKTPFCIKWLKTRSISLEHFRISIIDIWNRAVTKVFLYNGVINDITSSLKFLKKHIPHWHNDAEYPRCKNCFLWAAVQFRTTVESHRINTWGSHPALTAIMCVAGAAKTKVMQFIKLYRLLTFLLNGLNEKEKIFQALSIIIVICIKYEQCTASVAILSVHLQRLWQKYFARSPHNEFYSYNQLAQSCRVRLCSKPFKQYVTWARARARTHTQLSIWLSIYKYD